MTIVLIVSKTRMPKGVCVGGIIEQTGELIRLHNDRGGNLPADAPYEIGDRWEMVIKTAWNVREAPHLEDKQVTPIRKIEHIGSAGIIDYLNAHDLGMCLHKGSLNGAFEGCLQENTYITKNCVPKFSTQFWISDADLQHLCAFDKDYYLYKGTKIKFVGFQTPVSIIPAGTIVRLSLAHWFNPNDQWKEARCYLQISGWYL